MICHHYKLDATFKEKDALKGKIEKANLLFLDKKPDVAIDRNHDPLVPKTKASSKVDDSKSNSKKSNIKSKVHDRKSNSKKPNIKSKENSQSQEVYFQIGTIIHSKNGKISIGLTVVGIVISIIALFNV